MANEVILNFTGGKNDSLDPDRLQQNEVADVLNMRPNATGNVVNRDGIASVVANDNTTYSGGFTSEFEATLSSGTTRTILTHGNNFYYLNGSTPTLLTKTVSVENTSGAQYRWVFFNDLFIGVSRAGTKPVKWNGNPASDVDVLDVGTSGIVGGGVGPIDLAVWNRRLAVCQGTELFISDAETAEEWDTGDSNVFRFRGERGGEEKINALFDFQGTLIVFKKNNGIWGIEPGEGVSNSFNIKQIGHSVGCDAPYSIADLGRDLIWFHRSGFNTMSDLRDQGGLLPNGRVSKKIYRTVISQVNYSRIEQVVGVYNPDLDEYLVTLPVGSSQTTNNYVLRLDTEWTKNNQSPSWWVYQYAQEFRSLFIRPSQGISRIYGATHLGGIFQLNVGTADVGVGYIKSLKTRRFTLGAPQANKFLNTLFVDLYQDESFNVTINCYLDQERRRKTFTANVRGGAAVYDVSSYDSGATYAGATTGIEKRNVGKVSRDFQLEVYTTNSSGTFAINKFIQEYETMDDDLQSTMSG